MDQARGPVLQRPLQVEDSIQFLHQRIHECNACLPYTGSSLEYLCSDVPGSMWVCLALPVRLADQVTYMDLLRDAHVIFVDNVHRVTQRGIVNFRAMLCMVSVCCVVNLEVAGSKATLSLANSSC